MLFLVTNKYIFRNHYHQLEPRCKQDIGRDKQVTFIQCMDVKWSFNCLTHVMVARSVSFITPSLQQEHMQAHASTCHIHASKYSIVTPTIFTCGKHIDVISLLEHPTLWIQPSQKWCNYFGSTIDARV